MTSSDKNFVRNICLAAGLFFAFLLVAPIKYGPVSPPAEQQQASSAPGERAAAALDGSIPAETQRVEVPDAAATASLPDEFLDITLTIGDSKYLFSVRKDRENIPSLAAEVCNANAAALGLTAPELEAKCVVPVARSLHEQVDLTLEQLIPVELEVDGRSVQFEIDTAAPASIGEQAARFCTTYGAEFGVTEDTLADCNQKIMQALEGKVAAAIESRYPKHAPEQQQQQQPAKETAPTFQMDLDIQGRAVRFEVEANYESIGQQASTFCTAHGAEFGVTEASLGECQLTIQRALEERVVTYLQSQQTESAPAPEEQKEAPADPTFQMDLDIQGRAVRFEVEANYESIGRQATTFCTAHGAEFGVTEASLGECQLTIQRALEERVVAYLSSN